MFPRVNSIELLLKFNRSRVLRYIERLAFKLAFNVNIITESIGQLSEYPLLDLRSIVVIMQLLVESEVKIIVCHSFALPFIKKSLNSTKN